MSLTPGHVVDLYNCVANVKSMLRGPPNYLDKNQLLVLRESFENDIYPTADTIRSLSDSLGLSRPQVTIWFRNERVKLRKG